MFPPNSPIPTLKKLHALGLQEYNMHQTYFFLIYNYIFYTI